MFRFNKKYFLLFLLLFITEVIIAIFIHDSFIRPYAAYTLGILLVVLVEPKRMEAALTPPSNFSQD